MALTDLEVEQVREIFKQEACRRHYSGGAETSERGELRRLRRLLRSACSTLECARVEPWRWSGELLAWRREDQSRGRGSAVPAGRPADGEEARRRAMVGEYANGEVDPFGRYGV